MKKIILAVVTLFAVACEKQTTEVEPVYDFALYTAPSSTVVTAGQTIEIACELHKSLFYPLGAKFTISTEQIAGSGEIVAPQIVPQGEFSIFYTAQGEDHHTIQITVTDQFSNSEVSTIQFTNL